MPLRTGILACLVLLSAGCETTYKRTLPGDVRTIAVAPFANRTDQADLHQMVLEELRRAFRLDGRLTVIDDATQADSVLSGEVMEYVRQPARYDANNVVREYRLRFVANLTLTDKTRNAVLWTERGPQSTNYTGAAQRKLERFTNYVVVPATGLSVETENDAQRRMAREFAQDVVLKVIEGW